MVLIALSYTVSQNSGTAKICVTLWRLTVFTMVCGAMSLSCTKAREKNANQMYMAMRPNT